MKQAKPENIPSSTPPFSSIPSVTDRPSILQALNQPAIHKYPPSGLKPGEFPTLKITAIFFGQTPSVMINQKNLKEGDKIGEVTILRIEKNRIVVKFKDQVKILYP